MNLQENIRRILKEDKKTKSTNKEFSKYKDSKFNSLRDYTLQDIVDDWDSLSDHKNENIKTIKHFVNNPDKITDLVYDEKGLEDGYHRLIAAKILKKPRFSYRLVENLQENIRRILKEETEGIDTFLDEISNVHELSDELKNFIKEFINESNCKRINFSNFKMGVLGLALHSGVLVNSVTLKQSLPFLLFVVFHEVAHQYQFKKYGEDVMYDCYLGDISEEQAAKFMKKTEEVADEFATRKIRELQKRELIGPFTPPQVYKNIPMEKITMMVNNFRSDMKRKNIDSPTKISEYFYNMVKSEL